MPVPFDLEQPIACSKLGQKLETTREDISGFLPIKPEFHSTLPDRILSGKLTFFEHGLVFSDLRLGAFILPYSAIERVTFHGNTGSSKDWMQISLNEEGYNLVPCGYIAEPTFFLLVNHEFSNATSLRLQRLTEDLEMAQIRARNKRRKDRAEPQRRPQSARAGTSDASDEELKAEDASVEGISTAAKIATVAESEGLTDGTETEQPEIDEELPPVRMPLVDKAYE